ncbi:hypothetical protein GOBAR_DD36367 [Gossypium barbadense]|nr:hypothetical protein GOBAR_DD36367 [Gossypium barbadense]
MASALSVNSSISVRILQSSSYRGRVSIAQPRSFNLLPAPQSRRRYTVALANDLAEAFGDFDFEGFSSAPNDAEEEVEDDGEEDGNDDEVEERPVKLKNWQLRRLAAALKVGRRKTSIKTLAAELCLDRAVVLELLREPPPELLMISATLPDEPVKEPIHVMQQRWSAQKRLKKVQIDTLEKVYRRSKRPTNTMISSIVQVTNLPRKRVVKWFEDKRNEDGVPEHRQPYRRYGSETVFSD